jgi:hypothetical protein
MEGGAVLGEGADGCVLSNPLWPCAESAQKSGKIPRGNNHTVVSKIVKDSDTESMYLETAARILGPQLSEIYLAGLKGKCKPANSANPPSSDKVGDYKYAFDAVKTWPTKGYACEELGKHIKSGKGVTSTHKLMYISRYPSNLNEWLNNIKSHNLPFKQIMKSINPAIPALINIVQKFYQNPREELINLDLHHFNIFIRATGNTVQFGISDFGRCLLRQRNDTASSKKYIVDYLKEHIKYPMYSDYKQVPFEARLLNYCLKKNLDNIDPAVLLNNWIHDPAIYEYASYTGDIIILNRGIYGKYLVTHPLFIQMLEILQSISKKIRANQLESLSQNESAVIEYILTRYMAVSPFITILEQLSYYSPELREKIVEITSADFAGKPRPDSELCYITIFLNRIILGPYSSRSSLTQSLSSMQAADLSLVWSDVVTGL